VLYKTISFVLSFGLALPSSSEELLALLALLALLCVCCFMLVHFTEVKV